MKISILGATGSIGGPTAFQIATLGLADELVLIGGRRKNILEHYALDLSTAASTQDIEIRAGEYSDIAGSDIIIAAAGAHQALAQDRSHILKVQTEFSKEIAINIKNNCSNPFIINAINPVDSTNYAMQLAAGFDRMQLIGYSLNDSLRFREAVAAELKVRARQVEAFVIGEHGRTQVPLFSSVQVDNRKVDLSDLSRQKITSRIRQALQRFEELKAGRTAGWTCGVGLAKIVEVMTESSNEILPCSTVLNGEYGLYNLSMSVPLRLGRQKIIEIVEFELSADELEGLKKTADTLKNDAEFVEKLLKGVA